MGQKRGLEHSKIFHKFLFGADNTSTWEYTFFDKVGATLYHQKSLPSGFNEQNENLKGLTKGVGFLKESGLVSSPMDFKTKNRISLLDLEGILKRLIFPEMFSAEIFCTTTLDIRLYLFMNKANCPGQ